MLDFNWRIHSLSVAEVADLIGVSEHALRAWIARNPCDHHTGERRGGRVWLSARDAFHYLLVDELTSFGVGVRVAMFTAADICRQAGDDLAIEEFLIVRNHRGVSNFHLTNERPTDDKPALVLPVRALASALLDDARAVAATDAA